MLVSRKCRAIICIDYTDHVPEPLEEWRQWIEGDLAALAHDVSDDGVMMDYTVASVELMHP